MVITTRSTVLKCFSITGRLRTTGLTRESRLTQFDVIAFGKQWVVGGVIKPSRYLPSLLRGITKIKPRSIVFKTWCSFYVRMFKQLVMWLHSLSNIARRYFHEQPIAFVSQKVIFKSLLEMPRSILKSKIKFIFIIEYSAQELLTESYKDFNF